MPPKWEVVEEEAFSYADEERCWRTVYALDAQEAAEKAVELMEIDFAGEIGEQEIMIVRSPNGALQKFIVEIDTITVYCARKETV